jgi:uncharacterized protein (DUF2236 family)
MPKAMTLPRLLRRPAEKRLARLLWPGGAVNDDFLRPHGEPALIAPDSVSWQVFGNPLSVFIGGVAAVVLELAEPRVRTGVWENTSFRERPVQRLQRTGYAAMLSVYGPRSRVLPMIEGVRRLHDSLGGTAPDGRTFRASDPDLLEWVRATASFGFLEAYHAYVRPLEPTQRDRFHAEGEPIAQLYGCRASPRSQAEMRALFARMEGQLERSAIVHDFLAIAARMPALPRLLRPVQLLLVKAAVDLVPQGVRGRLELGDAWRLPAWQRRLVRLAGAGLDQGSLATHPSVQARARLESKEGSPDSRRTRPVEE